MTCFASQLFPAELQLSMGYIMSRTIDTKVHDVNL